MLLATAGPGWAFGISAIGYAAILFTVSVSVAAEWRDEGGAIGAAVATGLRYLRFSSGYGWLLLVGFLFGLSSAALRAMLPNITSDTLGGGSAVYGLLLGTFGAGALVGGLTRRRASKVFGDRLVSWSIFVFGSFGILLATSRVLSAAIATVFLAGVLWTWILATLESTFQLLTPDWVRGRTMSAFALSIVGVAPLGAVASGVLGDLVGAAQSLLAFSLLVIALGVAAWAMPLPALDRIEPPAMPHLEVSGGHPTPVTPTPVMCVTTWTIDGCEFEAFLEVLADLRRIRLSTGAYHWGVYWHADDIRRISEVFMVRSWQEHLQQHRRIDTNALKSIRHAESFSHPDSLVTSHLLSFDVSDPRRRPEWATLVADHQRLHRHRLTSRPDSEARA